MSKGLVIYHGPECWDGFCSAWLMHHFSGMDLDYHAAQYGELPPNVKGRDVWVLDFSYPRQSMQVMAQEAHNLVVLDHHKTAQADLEGLPYCTFDMGKSGAQLTWDWLTGIKGSGLQPEPWMVRYTADRDLWQWELHRSKEVNAALRSYPLDFAEWDKLYSTESPTSLTRDGKAILRAEKVIVREHLARAHEITFDGHRVLVVNASPHGLASEIAGGLAEGRPFGMCWFECGDVRQYDLRSRDGGVDVSEIAKAHGGGGHARAAGFEVPLHREEDAQ